MVNQTVVSSQEDATHPTTKQNKFKSGRPSFKRKKQRKASPSLKRGDSTNPPQKTTDADQLPMTKQSDAEADHKCHGRQGTSGADRSTNDSPMLQHQQPLNQRRRKNKANKWNQKQGFKSSGKENEIKRENIERVDEAVGCTNEKQISPSPQKQKSNSSISKSEFKISKKQNSKNEHTIHSRKAPQSPLDHNNIANEAPLEPEQVSSSSLQKGQDTEEKHQFNGRSNKHQRRRHHSHYRNNNNKTQKKSRKKDRIYQQPHRKNFDQSKALQCEARDDANLCDKMNESCSISPTPTNPSLGLVSNRDMTETDATSNPEQDGALEASKLDVEDKSACEKISTEITTNVVTTNAAGAAILSRLYRTDHCDKDSSCTMSSSSSSSLSASCAGEMPATIGTSSAGEGFENYACYSGENQQVCSDQFQQHEIPEHINSYHQHQVTYSTFANHAFCEEQPMFPVVAPNMFVQPESVAFAGPPGPFQYPMFVSGDISMQTSPPQYPLSPEIMYYTQSNIPDDGTAYLHYENSHRNDSVDPPTTIVQEEESFQQAEKKKTIWNVNAPAFEPKRKQ